MSRATLLSSTSGRKQSQQRFTSALAGEVCRDPVPKKSQVPGLEHISLKDTMELSQIFSQNSQRPDEMVAAVTSVRQLRKRGSERLSS